MRLSGPLSKGQQFYKHWTIQELQPHSTIILETFLNLTHLLIKCLDIFFHIHLVKLTKSLKRIKHNLMALLSVCNWRVILQQSNALITNLGKQPKEFFIWPLLRAAVNDHCAKLRLEKKPRTLFRYIHIKQKHYCKAKSEIWESSKFFKMQVVTISFYQLLFFDLHFQ